MSGHADVPTADTLAFLRRHLPPPPARLLEVGCGRGELAAALRRAGYQVVAVDSDKGAVRAARRRGVDARLARWPAFHDLSPHPFDAVLFTRSLHHIHPLGPAVARAHELLRPGGLVLVEELAFGEADDRTVAWLVGVLRLLDAAGALRRGAGTFADELLDAGDALAHWHEHAERRAADPHIHAVGAMTGALGARFQLIASAPAPYLYRYVRSVLPDTARGRRLLGRVLAEERTLGVLGGIALIGRRLVARRGTENGM